MHSNTTNKQYEILEHMADLKIRAYGKNQTEVFSNILKGMFETIKPKETRPAPLHGRPGYPKKQAIRNIKIKSPDLQSLLVDFLSEALYLSDVHNEAYFEAEFEKLTDKELEGEIKGTKIQSFEKEIKAVTYHDLEIKKSEKNWVATVLFDI